MREKRKSYPAVVSVGYKAKKEDRITVENKKVFLVSNTDDLSKIGKGQMIVVGSVGKRNKIKIAQKAQEMNIEIYNLNPKNFLKRNAPKESKK